MDNLLDKLKIYESRNSLRALALSLVLNYIISTKVEILKEL